MARCGVADAAALPAAERALLVGLRDPLRGLPPFGFDRAADAALLAGAPAAWGEEPGRAATGWSGCPARRPPLSRRYGRMAPGRCCAAARRGPGPGRSAAGSCCSPAAPPRWSAST
ncbi:hypothetical protein ACFQU2_05890 [Siccirubricoccus deserti]